MKFFIALFALFFAVPAEAKTVKVEVTGSIQEMAFYSVSGPDIVGEEPIRYFDPHSFVMDEYYAIDMVRAPSGSMILTDAEPYPDDPEIRFTNCTGMLRFVCLGYIYGETLDGFDYSFSPLTGDCCAIEFNPSGYIFIGDDIAESGGYRTINGEYLRFEFESFSVRVVPLPTPALALLSGLALLGLQRRFRQRDCWR